MKTKYMVDSCGVTLTHTNNKLEAYECYRTSNGPEVKLIEFNDYGQGTVLYRKVHRTSAPPSKRINHAS